MAKKLRILRTKGRPKMKKLLLDILKNITAEFPEVFEVLDVSVNLYRVDFQVFVGEEISQTGHGLYSFRKVFGNNALCAEHKDGFFIFARALPVILRDYVMGNIEEGLYV